MVTTHPRHRWYFVIAFVGLSACAPQSESNAPRTAPAVVDGTEQPTVQRDGLSAPVIWKRPVPSTNSDGHACSERISNLELTEIRADDTWAYFDVVHTKAGRPADQHPEAIPEVEMLVDGCPVVAPVASGRVWLDWADGSTITISLARIPDGEIDLFFSAFGRQAQVPFRKTGRSISYLRTQDRARFELRPVDEFGEGPTAVLNDPNCDEERDGDE